LIINKVGRISFILKAGEGLLSEHEVDRVEVGNALLVKLVERLGEHHLLN